MKKSDNQIPANVLTAEHDHKNLDAINAAFDAGRIDADAREYISRLYTDGMHWFRQVFYVLGQCFGAPKGVVMQYDYTNDCGINEPMKISDIIPLQAYLVNHRLDTDPMRNQFFTSAPGHKIDLAVSSIVTVIVAAQKSVERALAKVTGKYYDDYIERVAQTTQRVISEHARESNGRAIADKIRVKFREKFISSAPEAVLEIIGRGHENIAVELVRELDKITRPHMRLQDVWRVKCLFDLIPQARTFIERIHEIMPDRIISIRDKFFDVDNPRNYRDAKLIINIGTADAVVPMEIICQVRTFFEFERKTHDSYEVSRKNRRGADDATGRAADIMEQGLYKYNLMVYQCLSELFERIGWNILYSRGINVSLFEGFPRIKAGGFYPTRVIDAIFDKLDGAIENEVFHMKNAPAPLTNAQESQIFRWMTGFILVSAMPYPDDDWSVPSDTVAGRLFNFVMKEVRRHTK